MTKSSLSQGAPTFDRLAPEGGPPGEDVILEAFRDESTSRRERAIALAARYLEPETLVTQLRNEHDAVLRNAAIAALQRQGPYAVPHLLEVLSNEKDEEVLMFAIQIMGEIRAASGSGAIVPFLRHHDLNISQSAAVALGNMRATSSVPELVALLDEDLWLQVAAISALGEIGDPESVEPLARCLNNEMLAEVAIEALGKIGSPEALGPLVQLTTSDEYEMFRPQIVVSIGWILDRHPDPEADFSQVRRTIKSGGRDSLEAFLAGVLEKGERHLGHAAGFLAVAAGFKRLYALILRRLFDGGDDVRTLRLLCRADYEFRSVCEQSLDERDAVVRKAAISVLGHDLTVERLFQLIRDDDVDVRVAICGALGERRNVDAIPVLVDRVQHGESAEHLAAKHALAMMPGDGLGAMEPLLSDDSPEMTIAILRILEASRSKLFKPWVVDKLNSSSRDIRVLALRVLSNLPGDDVEATIRSFRLDTDEEVRAEVIDCLVRREPANLTAELIEQLETADTARYNAIRGLGRIRRPEAAEPLLSLFGKASQLERTAIIEALVQIEPAGLVEYLGEIVAQDDADIRKVAAKGLAHSATRENLPVLVALAADRDWYIRNHAAIAMQRLRMPESRKTLLTLVRDVEPIVAHAARVALEKIDESVRT